LGINTLVKFEWKGKETNYVLFRTEQGASKQTVRNEMASISGGQRAHCTGGGGRSNASSRRHGRSRGDCPTRNTAWGAGWSQKEDWRAGARAFWTRV